MTTLFEIIGIPKSASIDQMERGFEQWREDVEEKIVRSPTPALKAKLRRKLREGEDAYKAWQSDSPDDLPSVQSRESKSRIEFEDNVSNTEEHNIASENDFDLGLRNQLFDNGWTVGGERLLENFQWSYGAIKSCSTIDVFHLYVVHSNLEISKRADISHVISRYREVARAFSWPTRTVGCVNRFILCLTVSMVHEDLKIHLEKEVSDRTPFGNGLVQFFKYNRGMMSVIDLSDGKVFGKLTKVELSSTMDSSNKALRELREKFSHAAIKGT